MILGVGVWAVYPLGRTQRDAIKLAVEEADRHVAVAFGDRQMLRRRWLRVVDLACIVRGYASLLLAPVRRSRRKMIPAYVERIDAVLQEARSLTEKNQVG